MKVNKPSKISKLQPDDLITIEEQSIIAKQESELFHLKNIISKIPGSIYWKDKEGVYLGCNDFMLEMAGSNDVVGKTDFDLPWKEQAPQIRKNDLEVIKKDIPIELEESPILANGQQIIMLTRKAPLKNEQGNTIGILGVSLDITERKKLEAANVLLSQAKEQAEFTLDNIVANMPGHVYWKDRQGVYLGCNNRQAQSLGLRNGSEVIGKTDFDLPWAKDVASVFRENDIRIMELGETEIIEENAQIEGKEAIVLSQKTPLRDKNGNIVGILGISIDITERKKFEVELKEAREQEATVKAAAKESEFYKVIDAVPASIYWKDKSGHYLGCNKYTLEMAGLSQLSEILGKKDNELAWKNIAEKLFEIDQDVVLNNKKVEIEESPTLANKQEKIFFTTKTPLIDTAGKICGIIGISVDITARKKNEIALKDAKEKAEAANKAKTEFLENMRHDIRTPLTGITGFANIIANEASDPKIKEYADNLTASSYALLDLLNEILDSIKVNSGNVPLLKKKFDLKKRLFDVIKLNQAKAWYKNLELIFFFDPNIPSYVIGDYIRIHRITLELIANALNFTDKGYVKLTIHLAKASDKDLVIKLIVEDTGIGIPLDKQQEIFHQFKRLNPSYEGIYKGAGLGLAIVKQFLDDIEGEIYVESQVGIGTKFTCILPLKKPLLDDDFGCEEIPQVIATQSKALTPKNHIIKEISSKEVNSIRSHVLVIEDQGIASMVVKSMLSGLNCHVNIASSGKKAIQLVQENTYNLIFMDIGLPDIDGYEVTRRIRLYELNKGTHVPIVALTAHLDAENKQRCIEVGMNAVLSKPLAKEKAEDILNVFIPYRKKSEETEVEVNIGKFESFIIEEKIIDFELAKKQLDGNEELVHEVFAMLVNTFPEELEKLRSAYEKEDWLSIHAIAHKLKGGSAYCGTARLKEACSRLEIAIKNNKREYLSNLYKQLLIEINAIENIIKSQNY